MNALTGAGVLVEEKLFATLDPTVRRLVLPGSETIMLSDTVGFINKLPHQLIDAFKSTLEEVRTADLLLHVVDCANPSAAEQIRVVDSVLEEIGAGERPTIVVLNKTDLPGATVPRPVLDTRRGEGEVVQVSARTGAGLRDLLRAIEAALGAGKEEVHCTLGADEGRLLAWMRRLGRIVREEYHDGVVEVTALLPPKAAGQVRKQLGGHG
jgi:GTP-binding protein HflX